MGVYIKGIEMPAGNECLILTIYPDGQCFEHVYNGSFGAREERKAVPVPLHGDLIDRDALVKSDRMVGKLMMYGGEYVYTQSEIDRAPAIIPAEEDET